ncbi:MAG: hypothetical protein HS116_25050 [Planctomycetes bacterium]|nr:hypothetical protein [Planctomycetota bacterium]
MLNEQSIKRMIGVAEFLHHNPQRLVQDLSAMLEERKQVTPEQRSEWLRENWRTEEFAAAVLFNVLKEVEAHNWALGFFQNTPLADNEWPIVQTEMKDRGYKTWYLGEHGGKPKHQHVPRKTHVQYLLEQFATEWVEYQLKDLQIGDVNEAEKVQNELANEFLRAIDRLAGTMLDAIPKTSGLRATLGLHKDVVAANIPDANKLDLSAVGSNTGKISLEKMKRILDYFGRFASDVEVDRVPLAIRALFLSSQHTRDFWDFADLVTGWDVTGTHADFEDPRNVVPSVVRTEIWRSGKLEQMFGYKFGIVTRNTIASGKIRVASNKPIGWYFNKPSMAATYREENVQKNQGRMSSSVVHCFVSPDEWCHRMVEVNL